MTKNFLRISVLALSVVSLMGATLASAQDSNALLGRDADLPAGVSLTLLASGLDERTVSDGLLTSLQRIPLDSGETMDGRAIPPALALVPYESAHAVEVAQTLEQTHLVYVEAGEPSITIEGGEQVYREGQHVLVAAGSNYELRNDTTDCVSLLRLTVRPPYDMPVSASPLSDEPPNLPISCGEPSKLVSGGTSFFPALGSTLLFMARLTLDPDAYVSFDHGNPGWVVVMVESGTLHIAERGLDGDFASGMSAGSWISIPAGEPYSMWTVGTEPVVALLTGDVSAAYGLWAPPHFVSDAKKFGLVWDDQDWFAGSGPRSWEVQLFDSSPELDVRVLLRDQDTSTDTAGCVTAAVAELSIDPRISNLQEHANADGTPMKGSTEAESLTILTYEVPGFDGPITMADYVACRIPGDSQWPAETMRGKPVVAIDARMPLD